MYLLNELSPLTEHVGKLAVIEGENTVFVMWDFQENERIVRLVELDSPMSGQHLSLDLKANGVYLLEPIEVIERVTEWK